MSLPPSTSTSLAIDLLSGTTLEDRGDHLIVRTPSNPDYHWGNYVQVTGGDVDDATHWLSVFGSEFPGASHRAIGLCRRPQPGTWEEHGLHVEVDEALITRSAPAATSTPTGYVVRQLGSAEDWALLLDHELQENERSGEQPSVEYRSFMERQVDARRELVDRGSAGWFGAFATGRHGLASSLGIVLLDDDARYQSVLTHPDHRRRGLTRHLLAHAATWATDRGADRLVIVAESGSAAARLYERAGFEPGPTGYAAYSHN